MLLFLCAILVGLLAGAVGAVITMRFVLGGRP